MRIARQAGSTRRRPRLCQHHTQPPSALPTLIGWQGIRLNAPPDWFLKGYSGEWRDGFLQVGSPHSAEIDLKWTRSRRQTDLRFVLQQFLRTLERAKHKARQPFTGTLSPVDENCIEFRWRSDERAVGRIQRYPEHHTIVLFQLRSSSRHDALHQWARPIFETLRVAPDEDGWVEWSLYGLQTAAPANFRLEKSQLLTGQTSLTLQRRHERLVIERIARAEQLTKGYEFVEWVDHWLRWRGWKGVREPFTWDENDFGVHLCSRLGWGALLTECVVSPLRVRLPAWRVRAVAWFCQERNTVFHIQHFSAFSSNLIEEVMARTVCC
ncbi:MAG: hypothetical protein KatS3mg017_0166 [Fimbriimonadales bacterium]|nr:MAG: hypothetical protein KatS3mg017_0166 [Fimbriimonadales bacterium]GIV08917.1 MAG: hypothetical protein KatS3mg019_1008 [Fimbriimonadales bacterium]